MYYIYILVRRFIYRKIIKYTKIHELKQNIFTCIDNKLVCHASLTVGHVISAGL